MSNKYSNLTADEVIAILEGHTELFSNNDDNEYLNLVQQHREIKTKLQPFLDGFETDVFQFRDHVVKLMSEGDLEDWYNDNLMDYMNDAAREYDIHGSGYRYTDYDYGHDANCFWVPSTC